MTVPGDFKKSLGALAAVALLAVAVSTLVVSQHFWLDDSFISFHYARNLHDGSGLVYNPGERVEGYTNFLWTLAACAALELELDPLHFVQGASLVSFAVTIGILFCLGNAPPRRGSRSLLAPVFLASSPSFLVYSMTGMETVFFSALVTLSFLLVARRSYETRWGGLGLGLALVGIALTRFDGFVLALVLIACPALLDRDVKSTGRLVTILLVGLGTYNVWRFSYYPTPLPNTFYAKMGFSLDQLFDGALHVAKFVLETGHYAVILATVPFVLGVASRTAKLAAWVVCCQLGYVAIVGGDWMPLFRFMVPVMPLLFLMMQEGIWSLYDSMRAQIESNRYGGALAAATLVLLFGVHSAPLYRALTSGELSASWFSPREAVEIGARLTEALADDDLVAVEWGGIIPYQLRQPVLDTWGLTDSDIPRRDFSATRFGRQIDVEYLAERGPDVVLPCARIFSSADRAAASTERGSTCDYRFYMTLTRGHGYRVCIVAIDSDRYFPVLVKADDGTRDGLCVETQRKHASR